MRDRLTPAAAAALEAARIRSARTRWGRDFDAACDILVEHAADGDPAVLDLGPRAFAPASRRRLIGPFAELVDTRPVAVDRLQRAGIGLDDLADAYCAHVHDGARFDPSRHRPDTVRARAREHVTALADALERLRPEPLRLTARDGRIHAEPAGRGRA